MAAQAVTPAAEGAVYRSTQDRVTWSGAFQHKAARVDLWKYIGGVLLEP